MSRGPGRPGVHEHHRARGNHGLAQVVIELLLGVGVLRVEPPNAFMHCHFGINSGFWMKLARAREGLTEARTAAHRPRAVMSSLCDTDIRLVYSNSSVAGELSGIGIVPCAMVLSGRTNTARRCFLGIGSFLLNYGKAMLIGSGPTVAKPLEIAHRQLAGPPDIDGAQESDDDGHGLSRRGGRFDSRGRDSRDRTFV